MNSGDGIEQSDQSYPDLHVVNVRGEPLWEVCGAGVCVRSRSGSRAVEMFLWLCRSRGLKVPGG